MERQFFINWPAIVEEAKQRRKTQRLTQAQLAKMAGVSTPTVSRFENGEKDIQLSTVISLLNVLGMNDKRTLIFHKQQALLDHRKRVITFTGNDGNKLIPCAICSEALEDHFNGAGKNLLKIFQAHQDRIEHEARRKYLTGTLEADGSILLTTEDLG